MKNTFSLVVFIVVLTNGVFAQLKSGFDPQEARDMIQICNSFGYIDLYGKDDNILPKNYKKVYTSPAYGMDNKFQIYSTGKIGVIHFRGSTAKETSWYENLYASMIPVNDKIEINKKNFSYKVGENKAGRVHAGYMLAIYFFKDDLLKQIKELNKEGVYNFYITGHSQGGALAQLVRAYFQFLPEKELTSKNNFKVYAFANPMVGNVAFTKEYNELFCVPEMSYLLHNPSDFVIKLPVSYNDSTFWQKNLVDFMQNSKDFSFGGMAMDGALFMFKDRIAEIAKNMSKNIETQLIKELGEIKMPAFSDVVHYVHTGNVIQLPATEYPLELKDSTILKNPEVLKNYPKDADGIFVDKSLYKKSGFFMQHKAYNYYTAILKVHFPGEYERLDQKYFVLPNAIN